MVYASPVDLEYVSGEFYSNQNYYVSPAKLNSDYADVRFQREVKIFRRFCQQGRVLDVGCSTGGFLQQLRTCYPKSYEIMGTDVAGPALEYAVSQSIPVKVEPFLNWAGEEQKIDAICFWAVMEHVAEPRLFLAKAASMLSTGGHCFILVPNLRSLAHRILGRKYRYVMAEHVNYFSRETLRSLVQSEPVLQILNCGTSHFNPVVVWQDWRSTGEKQVPDDQRAALLAKTTAWKQSKGLRLLRGVYGWSEAVMNSLWLADNLWIVAKKRATI
jgi:2-polyprenyl-3-methyl-5-hydroxy-6-metoxy-1,4-benzoquinol methylase